MLTPPVLLLDLTVDDEPRDRRGLLDVASLPDRSRLVLSIGARAWPSVTLVALLRPHLNRLTVQVEGSSAAAIARWHDALLAGEVVPS